MAVELNYETIDRPFDSFMNRETSNEKQTGQPDTSGLASGASVGAGVEGGLSDLSSAGSSATTPGYNNAIHSGDILQDVWLSTWIKSQDYLPKARGFLIDARNGYIECMSMYVTGDAVFDGITLTGGDINFGKTSFTDSINPGYWIGPEGIYIGAATDTSRLKFDIAGGTFSVGGWDIGKNTISATGITLDSSEQTISVGSTDPGIIIDGVEKVIRTSTYATGSQGWSIEKDGSAEFNNLFARGEFHTQVLAYNAVHVTAGSTLLALSGGSLKSDLLSTSGTYSRILTESSYNLVMENGVDGILGEQLTYSIEANDPPSGHIQMFQTGDILRIKDGSGNDNWFKVVSSTDQSPIMLLENGDQILLQTGDSVLTEDAKSFSYNCTLESGTPSTFRAGAAIADYGKSGQGLIFSTVDSIHAPYLSVQTHSGSPWSSISEQVRLGNLNGALDYATDIYGFSVGSSSGTNANISIDPTNGIRIRSGTTNRFSVDSSGNAYLGALSVASGGYIRLGQTAWATGSGFWFGDVGGTAKLSIGSLSGSYLTWDGSSLVSNGTFSGTFSGNSLGSTSTYDTFTTTNSDNTSRISISRSIYGTPSQPANSFAVVAGSTIELTIGVPSGSVSDSIIKHTPHPDDTQQLLRSTSTTTLDLSSNEGVIDISATGSTGKLNLLKLINAGDGTPLTISQTKTSPTHAPIEVSGGLTSTNFRRLIKGSSRTIWESINTTSPNGNLSGVAGDLCMCGDGNIYRCTGTTNWIAM